MTAFSMNEMPRSFEPSLLGQVTLGICIAYGSILLINALVRLRAVRAVENECLEHLNSKT